MSQDVEITAVETVPYGVPVAADFADSYTDFEMSRAVLVRVHADTGHVGVGEACALQPEFYGETVESVDAAIRNYLAPAIVGEDPRRITRIAALMDEELARITCAKEGVDLAVHDLVGKLRGVPVHELLGGAVRDRVPAAVEIGWDDPETMAQRAVEAVGRGIGAIKLKGSADPEQDARRTRAVREAVGEDVELRIDPNTAWSVTEAIEFGRAVADCDLRVLEQPIPAGDPKGLARIRRELDVPVMGDESVFTPREAVRLYDHDAVDLLNLKVAKTAGLGRGKEFEAVARALGMTAIAGTELETGIAFAAKIHFAAAMREHPIASEFTELTQLEGLVLEDPPALDDGALPVPDGPGFGVTVDESLLEEYAIDTSA